MTRSGHGNELTLATGGIEDQANLLIGDGVALIHVFIGLISITETGFADNAIVHHVRFTVLIGLLSDGSARKRKHREHDQKGKNGPH